MLATAMRLRDLEPTEGEGPPLRPVLKPEQMERRQLELLRLHCGFNTGQP